MHYEYLEDIAVADVAFKAWGSTVEETFHAAAEATMNVMVENLDTIRNKQHRAISIKAKSMEMLLFDLLQELIFYKDAAQLLLRLSRVSISRQNSDFELSADAFGETIDPDKHDLIVDVKAVTLHRFQVIQTEKGWKATVILDI
jgi:SHS2 domain-containing protein